MQGLTNRALRSLFIELVRPDVVFTEFLRVQSAGSAARLKHRDLQEATATDGVPLVVQLIGADRDALVAAADALQTAGVTHINLNLGCPYGRMGPRRTGGGLLQDPEKLATIISDLRRIVDGSLSVKLRAGYNDPAQLFELLPLFTEAAVDFLIVHPRTVSQRYSGVADHAITAAVVEQTSIPVIANGDIRTADQGVRVRRQTGCAGLMLGRGAINDPFLFRRLKDQQPAPEQPRPAMLAAYLEALLARYEGLFSGDHQILAKMKEVLAFIDEPQLKTILKQLRKSRSVNAFRALLQEM